MTAADVCRSGYGHSQRARVTYAIRDEIYTKYGIQRGQRAGKYVIDHLMPLELGGLSDQKNLWPQLRADAKRKDRDENMLHRAVCRGEMRLHDARMAMLRRWGRLR
ncbi:MAG TPA: hypothetical protein VGC96_08920 [Candidatus Elarobacter sp.]